MMSAVKRHPNRSSLNRTRPFVRLAITVGILGLALILADFVVRSFEIERYRSVIETRLSQAMGLEVSIQGDFDVHLLPQPRFEAQDVVLRGAEGGGPLTFLHVGVLDFELDFHELLHRRLDIVNFVLSDGELYLNTASLERSAKSPVVGSVAEENRGKELGFHLRSLALERFRIFLRTDESETPRLIEVESLNISTQGGQSPTEIQAAGDFRGGHFDLNGRFGSVAELLRPTEPFPVFVQGWLFDVEVRAEGTLARPLALEGADIAVSLRLPDIASLATYFEAAKFPALGELHVTGRLKNPNGVFGVEQLNAKSESDLLRLELTGSIGDLFAFKGLQLEAQADIHASSWLEAVLNRSLPPFQALSGRASIFDKNGEIGIKGRATATAEQGRVVIDAEGGVDDLRKLEKVKLDLNIEAKDCASVSRLLKLEKPLPPVGPLSFHGKLTTQDRHMRLDDIVLDIRPSYGGSLKVEGHVADLESVQGVDLSAAFQGVDLRNIRSYVEQAIPDIGKVNGSAVMSDADGSLGLESFKIQGGQPGVLNLNLSGSLEQLRKLDDIVLDVRLEARDSEVVGELLGLKLPPTRGVAFKGRVTGSNESVLAKNAVVRIGDTELRGSFSGSFVEGKRPRIVAKLDSPSIDLRELGLAYPAFAEPSEPEGGTATSGEWQEQFDRWRSGGEPLPFEKLELVDLDLKINANTLIGRDGLNLQDTAIDVSLHEGDLVLKGHIKDPGKDLLEWLLKIEVSRSEPRVALQVDGQAIDLARAIPQMKQESAYAGNIDVFVDVTAEGGTYPELRSSLDGRFYVVYRDAVVITRFARAFVHNFLDMILPSFRAKSLPPSKCFVLGLDIEKGVATIEDFFLEGDKVILRGQGQIDFVKDAYAMRLQPTVSDPKLLSVVPTVNVRGPILDPVFSPVPFSLLTSAVQGFATRILKPGDVLLEHFRKQASTYEDFCKLPPTSRGTGKKRADQSAR